MLPPRMMRVSIICFFRDGPFMRPARYGRPLFTAGGDVAALEVFGLHVVALGHCGSDVANVCRGKPPEHCILLFGREVGGERFESRESACAGGAHEATAFAA